MGATWRMWLNNSCSASCLYRYGSKLLLLGCYYFWLIVLDARSANLLIPTPHLCLRICPSSTSGWISIPESIIRSNAQIPSVRFVVASLLYASCTANPRHKFARRISNEPCIRGGWAYVAARGPRTSCTRLRHRGGGWLIVSRGVQLIDEMYRELGQAHASL